MNAISFKGFLAPQFIPWYAFEATTESFLRFWEDLISPPQPSPLWEFESPSDFSQAKSPIEKKNWLQIVLAERQAARWARPTTHGHERRRVPRNVHSKDEQIIHWKARHSARLEQLIREQARLRPAKRWLVQLGNPAIDQEGLLQTIERALNERCH